MFNKLKLKYYKKIIKFKNKLSFNDFDLITNYGMFSGNTNLYKTLEIFRLLMQVKNIQGDIIELGIHHGNTSLLLKKIIEIFNLKKRLYLLDHFKGLTTYVKKDTKISRQDFNRYIGHKKIILDLFKFFKFKNFEIIDKDATKIKKNFFKNKKFCFCYFDMDLYEPTIKALNAIDGSVVKNGLIIFDQGNKKRWSEKIAIKEFLKSNSKYKKIILKYKRNPDIVLKKIKN